MRTTTLRMKMTMMTKWTAAAADTGKNMVAAAVAATVAANVDEDKETKNTPPMTLTLTTAADTRTEGSCVDRG
jgi:hypothetical protein